MDAFSENRTSLYALSVPLTVHSMFDWPEHNHTSPTSTSRTVCVRVAVRAVNTCGPPARNVGMVSVQWPDASDLVVRVTLDSVTVTCSLGFARPQISLG